MHGRTEALRNTVLAARNCSFSPLRGEKVGMRGVAAYLNFEALHCVSAPSPGLLRLRLQSRPLPARRGEVSAVLPFSRRDFSFRARASGQPCPFRCFPCTVSKKGKRNAERRVVKPALAARGALCGARSPLGVPLRLLPGRQLVPRALHQAMLRGSSPGRSVLYGRPNRGAETLRCSTGVTRAGTK